MSKDTFYFSHDFNAKDDPKCMVLIDQLGLEGYGIFWVLIETLRTQPDYKCSMKVLPSLAKRYSTSAEKMLAVVKSYDLFVVDEEDFFFSESLKRRMQYLDNKRQRLSEAGSMGNKKRWGSNQLSPGDGVAITTQSQVKESKVKESKVNIPTEEDFLIHSKTLLGDKYQSYEFSLKAKYAQWVGDGWKDGNKNAIRNWKNKLANTIPYLKPFGVSENKTRRQLL